MAEDFYNTEVTMRVIWSCFIAPIGKTILNSDLEMWGNRREYQLLETQNNIGLPHPFPAHVPLGIVS